MAKTNSYISLVRATEDEINKEYNEIIEGQIIFDTTNKTISCDEQGKRVVYVGNILTKGAVGKELDASYDPSNQTYTLRRDYTIGEYFTIDGELYTVTGGGMVKGRSFAKINFKTQTVPTRKVNLCDELKNLSVSTGQLNNKITNKVKLNGTAVNSINFELSGTTLTITTS